MTDSSYTLLVAERLLQGRGPALDDVFAPSSYLASHEKWAHQARPGYPRPLEVHAEPLPSGTVTLWYPQAPAWISAGWLALRRPFVDDTVFNSLGQYDIYREEALQLALAADLAGLCAALVFLLARLQLPLPVSLLVALAFAFGSPLLSTASRAVWTHSWGLVLALMAWHHLLRGIWHERRWQPVWLGVLCSFLYFCRPALVTQILVLTALALWHDRKRGLQMMATGAVCGLLWLGWNHWQLGGALPSYYRHAALDLSHFFTGLYGVLLSPSRGHFVYVPFLLPLVLWLVAHFRQWEHPAVVWAALAGVFGHALLLACYGNWWGGHSFGSRLMMDTLAPSAVLVVSTLALPLTQRQRRRERVVLALCALLVAGGVLVHTRGASDRLTFRWNVTPGPIDADPTRALDWHQVQFLAGIQQWPLPKSVQHLPPNVPLHIGQPQAAPWLLEGWSEAEQHLRWTEAPSARLVWYEPKGQSATVELLIRTLLTTGPKQQLRQQRVIATVRSEPDGQILGSQTWVLPDEQWRTLRVPFVSGPAGNRTLTLSMPDAVVPRDLTGSGEVRRLGVAVTTVTISTQPLYHLPVLP
jgi:hypothetical protein